MRERRNVWGMDLGAHALKAVKLREADGQVCLDAFEVIEHACAASAPEADRRKAVRDSLRRLLGRVDLSDSHVLASLPPASGWVRFLHLPPLDHSAVPDVVRFEAAQQVPHPLDRVICQWQTFRDPDRPSAPDVDVGIFAVPKLDVGERLLLFSEQGVGLDGMQMPSLALYDVLAFEGYLDAPGAVLLADVGARNTVLVAGQGRTIWARTVDLGGERFTQALAGAFGLSGEEAERLKCSAADSPDAKQVFHAMRSAANDLAGEIRRAAADCAAAHGSPQVLQVVLAGGASRMPGLPALVQEALGMRVGRLDKYARVNLCPSLNTEAFAAAAPALAVAIGLALQGLARTPVNVDFLPRGIAAKLDWFQSNWRRVLGRVLGKGPG